MPTKTNTHKMVIRIIAGPTLKPPSNCVEAPAANNNEGVSNNIIGNINFFIFINFEMLLFTPQCLISDTFYLYAHSITSIRKQIIQVRILQYKNNGMEIREI